MAFHFKHFVVEDDLSTMPVGTDAMLLGAWADPGSARSILDIGTGCGVLALMMGQRSSARIDAIDIDRDSCRQAQRNFSSSPWSNQLVSHCIPLEEFAGQKQASYEFILSNPPFFSRSLRSPSVKRNLARHETGLSQEVLLDSVTMLLAGGGRFTVILPYGTFPRFSAAAAERGLHALMMTVVRSFPGNPPIRTLACFSNSAGNAPVRQELIIFDAPGIFSAGYLELTSGFHNF